MRGVAHGALTARGRRACALIFAHWRALNRSSSQRSMPAGVALLLLLVSSCLLSACVSVCCYSQFSFM
jgi:hypothetical protein